MAWPGPTHHLVCDGSHLERADSSVHWILTRTISSVQDGELVQPVCSCETKCKSIVGRWDGQPLLHDPQTGLRCRGSLGTTMVAARSWVKTRLIATFDDLPNRFPTLEKLLAPEMARQDPVLGRGRGLGTDRSGSDAISRRTALRGHSAAHSLMGVTPPLRCHTTLKVFAFDTAVVLSSDSKP
jgi:hypothetical protein